jgi:hypothetical protein
MHLQTEKKRRSETGWLAAALVASAELVCLLHAFRTFCGGREHQVSRRTRDFGLEDARRHRRRPLADHCCFSQKDNSPCEAEPPITQGMPIAIWPSAAADTQPSATAPTPT